MPDQPPDQQHDEPPPRRFSRQAIASMLTHAAAIVGTVVLIWAGAFQHLTGDLNGQAAGIAQETNPDDEEARHRLSHYERERTHVLVGAGLLSAIVLAFGIALLHGRIRLVRSQEDLSATLENMAQGIIMVDAQRRVRVISRRAVEMLGLPAHLSRPGVKFDALRAWQIGVGEIAGSPADAAGDARPLTQADLGGHGQRYERVRPNGITLDIRNELLPDGSAVRTYTDITDLRRAAEDIARARDTAEAASKARAGFLAMMSHEIRTPLSGIIGAADLLLAGGPGPEERGYVEIIAASGRHLLRLIDDTLDFSRLDAGRLDLEDTAFDLPVAVRGAAALLAGQAEARLLRLTVTIAPGVPRYVRGDERRLRQVLINLIGNGVKFTERGGVDVMVTATPGEDGRTRVRFAVTDTGIGIAPEAMSQLFTEFTQADSSISRRFGGSGLGLAISRRLVALMGGSLGAESVPGQGATFRFELDLAPGTPAVAMPPALAVPGRTLHVLLAEDDPTNQLIARRLLERQGHRVDGVANGAEAARAAAAVDYDVVLMDVMMPEMDGLAATRAIRALPGPRGRVAVIGLTAGATPDDAARCHAAGMTGFASKPVSAEKLTRTLLEAGVLEAGVPDAGVPDAGVPDAEVPDLDVPDAEVRAATEPPLLDTAHLDGLRAELGTGVLEPILAGFLAEAPSYLADIAGAPGSDPARLAAHCHLLAGVARNVGLPRLASAAQRLEARAADAAARTGLAAAVAAAGEPSLAALRTYRAALLAPAG